MIVEININEPTKDAPKLDVMGESRAISKANIVRAPYDALTEKRTGKYAGAKIGDFFYITYASASKHFSEGQLTDTSYFKFRLISKKIINYLGYD